MSTVELLSTLRERDVRLWVEDGRLKADAPPGRLDDGLRAQLVERKGELLALLESSQASLASPRAVVPLKPTGERPPIFGFPGHNGDVFCYRGLADHLDSEQPLYGVEPKGADGGPTAESVEEMAAFAVEQIRALRPDGPYVIAGYCAGGTIAFEVAAQLERAGEDVARLLLLGSPFPSVYRENRVDSAVRTMRYRIRRHGPALSSGPVRERMDYVRDRMRHRAEAAAGRSDPALENRRRIETTTMELIRAYEPGRYGGRIDLVIPDEAWRHSGERPEAWRSVAAAVVERVGPDGCDGDYMLQDPHVPFIAALVRSALDNDEEEQDGTPG